MRPLCNATKLSCTDCLINKLDLLTNAINKQVPMSSYALDTMKWELAGNKQEFILESLDESLQITVQSKQVGIVIIVKYAI